MNEISAIRNQFKLLRDEQGKKIYFDNACSTLKPDSVVQGCDEYAYKISGCHGRSSHQTSKLVNACYEDARQKIKSFISAEHNEEIIFVKNTTEALNVVASGYPWDNKKSVVTTNIEHNSNLIPWVNLLRSQKIKKHELIKINVNDDSFKLDELDLLLKKGNVQLVSIPHISHVTGMKFPIEEIIKMSHREGALVMIDAAQSIGTQKISVKELGADFMAFSFQKAFGPTGLGVLYGKKEHLEKINPIIVGGGSVVDVDERGYTYADLPHRLEAGLQNYSALWGVPAALEFINRIRNLNICKDIENLNKLFTELIISEPGLEILGPKSPLLRSGIINVASKSLKASDLVDILSQSCGVLARDGVHCAHLWYRQNHLSPSVRFSLSAYNTSEEVYKVFNHLRILGSR